MDGTDYEAEGSNAWLMPIMMAEVVVSAGLAGYRITLDLLWWWHGR